MGILRYLFSRAPRGEVAARADSPAAVPVVEVAIEKRTAEPVEPDPAAETQVMNPPAPQAETPEARTETPEPAPEPQEPEQEQAAEPAPQEPEADERPAESDTDRFMALAKAVGPELAYRALQEGLDVTAAMALRIEELETTVTSQRKIIEDAHLDGEPAPLTFHDASAALTQGRVAALVEKGFTPGQARFAASIKLPENKGRN